MLAVLPVWYLLMQLIPGAETQLEYVHGGPTMLLIDASRFAVMYWWAVLLISVGALLAAWKYWYGPVAAGRLMHELGLVREDAV